MSTHPITSSKSESELDKISSPSKSGACVSSIPEDLFGTNHPISADDFNILKSSSTISITPKVSKDNSKTDAAGLFNASTTDNTIVKDLFGATSPPVLKSAKSTGHSLPSPPPSDLFPVSSKPSSLNWPDLGPPPFPTASSSASVSSSIPVISQSFPSDISDAVHFPPPNTPKLNIDLPQTIFASAFPTLPPSQLPSEILTHLHPSVSASTNSLNMLPSHSLFPPSPSQRKQPHQTTELFPEFPPSSSSHDTSISSIFDQSAPMSSFSPPVPRPSPEAPPPPPSQHHQQQLQQRPQHSHHLPQSHSSHALAAIASTALASKSAMPAPTAPSSLSSSSKSINSSSPSQPIKKSIQKDVPPGMIRTPHGLIPASPTPIVATAPTPEKLSKTSIPNPNLNRTMLSLNAAATMRLSTSAHNMGAAAPSPVSIIPTTATAPSLPRSMSIPGLPASHSVDSQPPPFTMMPPVAVPATNSSTTINSNTIEFSQSASIPPAPRSAAQYSIPKTIRQSPAPPSVYNPVVTVPLSTPTQPTTISTNTHHAQNTDDFYATTRNDSMVPPNPTQINFSAFASAPGRYSGGVVTNHPSVAASVLNSHAAPVRDSWGLPSVPSNGIATPAPTTTSSLPLSNTSSVDTLFDSLKPNSNLVPPLSQHYHPQHPSQQSHPQHPSQQNHHPPLNASNHLLALSFPDPTFGSNVTITSPFASPAKGTSSNYQYDVPHTTPSPTLPSSSSNSHKSSTFTNLNSTIGYSHHRGSSGGGSGKVLPPVTYGPHAFPPPCPVARFGFGGQLAVMIPQSQSQQGRSGSGSLSKDVIVGTGGEMMWSLPSPTEEERNSWVTVGHVKIYSMRDLLLPSSSLQEKSVDGKFLYDPNIAANVTSTLPTISVTSSNSSSSSYLLEEERMQQLLTTFPGPLTVTTNTDSVNQFIQKQIEWEKKSLAAAAAVAVVGSSNYTDVSSSPSSLLLWQLLQVMIEFNGLVHTDPSATTTTTSSAIGSESSETVEYKIVKLLLQSHKIHTEASITTTTTTTTASIGVSSPMKDISIPSASSCSSNRSIPTTTMSMTSSGSSIEKLKEVEDLLLLGQRKEAALAAADSGNWPLAFIISGVCEKELYQQLVKKYADDYFTGSASGGGGGSGSGAHNELIPLHMMCLLFSNQAESTLKFGGKQLLSTLLPSSDSFGTNPVIAPIPISPTPILSDWRRIVASLLSNKSDDWASLLRLYAERLRIEYQDISASHFTLLVTGVLPGWSPPLLPTSSHAPVPLQQPVPLSATGSTTTAMMDDKARARVSPLHLIGCDASLPSNRHLKNSQAIAGLFMSEIIEWLALRRTSTIASTTTGNSLVGLFGRKASEKVIRPEVTAKEMERLRRARIALCPLKLRLAYLYCDTGNVKLAGQYVTEIRTIVNASENDTLDSQQPAHPIANKIGKVKAFSSGFQRALLELSDRISEFEKKTSATTSGSSATSSSSGIPTSSSGSSNSIWGRGLGSAFLSALSVPNLKELVGEGPSSENHTTSSNNHISGENNPDFEPSNKQEQQYQQQQQLKQRQLNQYSRHPSHQSLLQSQPQDSQFPRMSQDPGHHKSLSQNNMSQINNNNNNSNDLRELNGSSKKEIVMNGSGKQNVVSGSGKQTSNSGKGGTSTGGSEKLEKASEGGQGSGKETKDDNKSETATSGIFGNVHQQLMKLMYPNAKTVGDNIGKKLEAYFDKATGKWVFPGEEDAAANDPAAAPPPTGPLPGHHPAATSGTPGGPPSMMSATGTSQSSKDSHTPYDPLAALMAPPPMRTSSSSYVNAMDTDPLAALMAPPPRSIAGSGFGSSSIGSGSGPPISMYGGSSMMPPPMSNTFTMTPPLPPSLPSGAMPLQSQPPMPNVWVPPKMTSSTSYSTFTTPFMNMTDPNDSSNNTPPPPEPGPEPRESASQPDSSPSPNYDINSN